MLARRLARANPQPALGSRRPQPKIAQDRLAAAFARHGATARVPALRKSAEDDRFSRRGRRLC
jgi:hypothetical protein